MHVKYFYRNHSNNKTLTKTFPQRYVSEWRKKQAKQKDIHLHADDCGEMKN